ncbi:MAG: serine/threonine-protein phosphatase [Lachnospiraceae bacterium]|nr:serine/threonine-protein phosphatase [Lachnospiraceae bacterium]
MVFQDIQSGTFIINLIAALILAATLIQHILYKGEKVVSSRIFVTMILSDLVGAVGWMIYEITGMDHIPARAYLNPLFDTVYLISLNICCISFAVNLATRAGFADKVRRHIPVILLASGLDIMIILVRGILWVTSPDTAYTLIRILGYISNSILWIAVALSLICLIMIDRALTALPVLLIIIKLYFNVALDEVHISAFLLSICIAYIYFSMLQRGLLIQLGGIILALCIISTLVIGNIVTSSAFISYLKTIHDRNDSHMSDVITEMEKYDSLSWLMEYWMAHPEEIVYGNEYELDDELYARVNNRLTEVPPEKVEALPDSLKEFYAYICYHDIADLFETEFSLHNLDDLFLIVPDGTETALIIFDAERNEDGSYRLGERRDVHEEQLEWDNYNRGISDTVEWTWGNYSDNEDFGFYRELPFGSDGQTAYLCNSFKRSEVYDHLEFISTSRDRAMRYLLFVAVVILLSLYVMVLKPLSKISRTVKNYHQNKDAEAVASDMSRIKVQNELGAFAEEFSSLAKEMERYTTQVAFLAGEKERVSTELRMASAIQSQALPSDFPAYPDRSEFDIYADMKPAKAVGGDFYDFFLTDNSHLAFVIGDVSDKGVPAALFMMSVKDMIDYRAQEGGSPGEILTEVNSKLCRNNDAAMFVTVWLGILDLKTGDLICSRAGHEMPAVSAGREGFRIFDDGSHGIALGVIPDEQYADCTMHLGSDDMVFIYTDGVSEAIDPDEDFYGTERLLACLDRAIDDTPEGVITKVRKDVESHVKGAEQFDDMTMLCVKFRNNQSPAS